MSADAEACAIRQAMDLAARAGVDGDAATLAKLLAQHPTLATARTADAFNVTLLHFSAANGLPDELQRTPANAVEICELLLAAGCDPNATSSGYGGGPNSTPLCLLVSSWHPFKAGVQPDLVHALVGGGAHADGNLGDGAPMTTALGFGYTKAARALVEAGARTDNLYFAAGLDHVEAVKAWFTSTTGSRLRDGALGTYAPAINKDSSGDLGDATSHTAYVQEAFHFAVSHGATSAATELLSRGADVNGRTKGHHCELPLLQTAFLQRTDMALWLLERGADPDLACGKRSCSAREHVTKQGPDALRTAIQNL